MTKQSQTQVQLHHKLELCRFLQIGRLDQEEQQEEDEGEEDEEVTIEEEDWSESDSDTVQGSTTASETDV